MTKINQIRNCKRNDGGNSKARAVVAAFAITLTGCASAKVGYYTLIPPQSSAQMSKKLASYDIEVLPVTIPAQIDQSQIVIRRGDGGADVQDLARWTGSPSDQIRQAVSSELTTRLGTRDVTGMSVPAGTSVAKVRINIQRLEFWKDDHVVLDATWQIIHGEKSGEVCEKALKVPSLKGDEQLVHAAQQAIVQLADGIAVTLSRGGC